MNVNYLSVVCEAPVVYTDDFEAYSAGILGGQGNWITSLGEMVVVDVAGDNQIRNNVAGASIVTYNAVISNSQYSQVVIDTVTNGAKIGVAVRVSGVGATCDGYVLLTRDNEASIYRIDDGVATLLANGAVTVVAGGILKLSATGTELSCYYNGALITTISGDGKLTDAFYGSGQVGLAGSSSDVGLKIDDWRGGLL